MSAFPIPGRPAAAAPGQGGLRGLVVATLGLTLAALLAPAGCADDPAVVEDFDSLSIAADPSEGWAPLSVGFSADFSPEGEDVVAPAGTTYQWDFGDDAKSSETAPRHEYKRPGEYAVRLEVTGADLSGTADTVVMVTAWEPAAWQAQADAICAETQQLAAERSSGADGPNVPDLNRGATLATAEVEKLRALGLPGEGREEVEVWLDDLSAAAEMFQGFATSFAADSGDPALVELNAQLDAAYASVAEEATKLGLDSCAGDTGG
jgi:PKD repeat protein